MTTESQQPEQRIALPVDLVQLVFGILNDVPGEASYVARRRIETEGLTITGMAAPVADPPADPPPNRAGRRRK